MKKLLLILLLFCFSFANAQTPVPIIQRYNMLKGIISPYYLIGANDTAARKKYVDSLIAYGYKRSIVDSLLNLKINATEKGQQGGVATLDPYGFVPSSQNNYGLTSNTVAEGSSVHQYTGGYSFSGWIPSLLTKYYIAEGVILNIGGDTLFNVVRIDSNNLHVEDTGGALIQRYSYDKGMTWTNYTTTYNSPYDDRNVIGGMTTNGRIILIFRRYRSANTNDIGRIYSDNKGASWSSYSPISTSIANAQTFGPIIKTGDGKYNCIIDGTADIQIYESTNGDAWSYKSTISTRTGIDETAIAYIGNNKMIAISRDESIPDSTYFMHRSTDNGNTWNYLGRTKMNNNLLGISHSAPCIVWDSIRGNIIAMSTTRKLNSFSPTEDSLHIYIQSSDSAFSNEWKEQLCHHRPFPNLTIFYGYPTITRLESGNFIGLITDLSYKHSTNLYTYIPGDGFANLYQFDINYKTSNNIFAFNRYSLPVVYNKITNNYDFKNQKNTINIDYADPYAYLQGQKGLILSTPVDHSTNIFEAVSQKGDSIYAKIKTYGDVILSKSITADSLIRIGGTSQQRLMADGSTNSDSYILNQNSSSILQNIWLGEGGMLRLSRSGYPTLKGEMVYDIGGYRISGFDGLFVFGKGSLSSFTPNLTIDSGNGTFSATVKATQYKLSALNTAPSSSSDTGTTGEIRFTTTGIFICTATDTWIKCVGATF